MSTIEIVSYPQNIYIETSIGHSTCTDIEINKRSLEITTHSENNSTCNTIEIIHADSPSLEINASYGDTEPSCSNIDLITIDQNIVEINSDLNIILPNVLVENVIGLTQLIQYYINNLAFVDGGTP